MVTTLFWNIDSFWSHENDDREFAKLVSQLCIEYSVDIAVLIECRLPPEQILHSFQPSDLYRSIPSRENSAVIARFDSRYIDRMVPPVPNNRADYWHLNLPLHKSVILSALHGPDRRNHSPEKQRLFFAQVATNVSWAEGQVGHRRSIVFGDFNSNPFEFPVGSLTGMNAVASRRVAKKKSKKSYGIPYPFFYNPMWNFFGDFRSNDCPPGTYYFDGSNPHEFYWHMLDQVLLRPELCETLASNGIKIISKIGHQSLLTQNGIPDRSIASDHLPLLFTLNLREQA